MNYRTEQEGFWAGEFGNDYIGRNEGAELLAANLHFFARALRGARGVGSCVEFGANIGMNLRALQLLFPGQQQYGVEINEEAARRLAQVIPAGNVARQSILDYVPPRTHDLALIKGVLIHINPEVLPEVYDKLVAASSRYVLVAEYYNPSPVAIPYRGHGDRLFKRDFAGEMMQRHPGLALVDYGFAWRHDPHCPQDDLTWFLLEKRG
jgi:spore coat polysaccharide biosynthesis protein SpsF